MKIYVIPNYHKSIVQTTSQSIVQRKYIKLLESEYDVKVLYPKWGNEINGVIDAKYYVNLDIGGYSNRAVLPYEYIQYLSKCDLKDSIIYTFQNDNAIDLMAQLYRPPFVFPKIINHFIAGDEYSAKNPKNLKRIMGFSLCSVFNSAYSKEMIEKDMKGIGIVPSMFSWGDNDFATIGIPMEEMSKHQETKKHDKFTFIYAGNSLMNFKRIDRLIDIYEKLYIMGKDFVVKFYLLDKDIDNELLKKPYIEVNKTLSREEFWKESSRCHAFISTSTGESYGIAYWELCNNNCIGLFENKPWVNVIGNVDETFKFNSIEEGVSKAILLIDEYKRMNDMFNEWWNKNKNRHSGKENDIKYLKIIKRFVDNFTL